MLATEQLTFGACRLGEALDDQKGEPRPFWACVASSQFGSSDLYRASYTCSAMCRNPCSTIRLDSAQYGMKA